MAVQNPVQLSATSELQPDAALLRPRADFYRDAHPGPGDVLLIILVYRRPTPQGYADERVVAPADSLAPRALPDLLLTAAQLLS